MTNVKKKVIGKLSSREVQSQRRRRATVHNIVYYILYIYILLCSRNTCILYRCIQRAWAAGSFLEIFGYDRCMAVAGVGCVWRARSGRTASCRAAATAAAALIRMPRVVGWGIFFSFPLPGYIVEPKGLCLPSWWLWRRRQWCRENSRSEGVRLKISGEKERNCFSHPCPLHLHLHPYTANHYLHQHSLPPTLSRAPWHLITATRRRSTVSYARPPPCT